MKRLRIQLIRSVIGEPLKNKRTIKALGLRRLNSVVEHRATPQILGMIKRVQHLLLYKEIN
ncbi:MAG: 50S ribosomal protein L30 [Bacteroidales bacterium]|nr:50S ribosomal protein L30 [Bacteroidales bacterium]